MLDRFGVALAAALVLASPSLADPIIGSGDVMGNGTASPRTPTDTPVLNVLGQAGVTFPLSTANGGTGTGTLGTGVGAAFSNPVNANAGFGLVNGAQTNDDCLKWSASGITDSGVLCLVPPSPIPQGRLTFATGVPVMTSIVTAGATVYYTPYGGNTVPVWNGTSFLATAFSELSQALSDTAKSPAAAVAANVYDVFVWNDGGTIRATRGPTWASGGGSNTARGTGAGSTALVRVNGLLVNQVAITNGPAAGFGTYVGTIETDAGGATVTWDLGGSSAGGRPAILNVWNAFNRVRFNPNVIDSTASHTYTTATFRAWNAQNTMRISFVIGRQDADQELATLNALVVNSTAAVYSQLGIAVDGTTTPAATSSIAATAAAAAQSTLTATYSTFLIGAHFLQVVEDGNGTGASTFNGAPFQFFTVNLVM